MAEAVRSSTEAPTSNGLIPNDLYAEVPRFIDKKTLLEYLKNVEHNPSVAEGNINVDHQKKQLNTLFPLTYFVYRPSSVISIKTSPLRRSYPVRNLLHRANRRRLFWSKANDSPHRTVLIWEVYIC